MLIFIFLFSFCKADFYGLTVEASDLDIISGVVHSEKSCFIKQNKDHNCLIFKVEAVPNEEWPNIVPESTYLMPGAGTPKNLGLKKVQKMTNSHVYVFPIRQTIKDSKIYRPYYPPIALGDLSRSIGASKTVEPSSPLRERIPEYCEGRKWNRFYPPASREQQQSAALVRSYTPCILDMNIYRWTEPKVPVRPPSNVEDISMTTTDEMDYSYIPIHILEYQNAVLESIINDSNNMKKEDDEDDDEDDENVAEDTEMYNQDTTHHVHNRINQFFLGFPNMACIYDTKYKISCNFESNLDEPLEEEGRGEEEGGAEEEVDEGQEVMDYGMSNPVISV
eukprot:GHVL01024218.1.p1 GENE.GHVL01024218.1~~GHVL01024218.1.p1  ORF type:complete len:349 (+),score=73.39 GHVL01024218.1:43-1047(+)